MRATGFLMVAVVFVAVALLDGSDRSPFGSGFAPDQPLAPVGQAIVLGSVVCLLLALVYALTSLSRQVARLMSVVRQRK